MSDYRLIPSIEELRKRTAVRALEGRYGHQATVDALRAGTAAVRDALGEGDGSLSNEATVAARVEAVARARLEEQFSPSLTGVINATGVVVHTNLGRAPLARAALDRVAAVAGGYSTLEYDLARGERG